MQFHFSQLISINGFNDLKDKVGTILINEMMLFLISQITMSISGKGKIVLIHWQFVFIDHVYRAIPIYLWGYSWKPNQIECTALNNIHTD